jgi:hypothetical protein
MQLDIYDFTRFSKVEKSNDEILARIRALKPP